jgi:hypothetical protein
MIEREAGMPPRLQLCVCRFCGKQWHEPVDELWPHCPKCDRLWKNVDEPVLPIKFPVLLSEKIDHGVTFEEKGQNSEGE